MSEIFQHFIWEYVRMNGIRLLDRKCFFEQNILCNMKCHSFKIQWTMGISDAEAAFLCTKFNPPLVMRRKIVP